MCGQQRRSGINRCWLASFAIAVFLSANVALGESVVYSQFPNTAAKGSFRDSDDGLFRVAPDEVFFDLDENGVKDLLFRHSLVPRSSRIDASAVDLLRSAEEGVAVVRRTVEGLRSLAFAGATQSVRDEDELGSYQIQIDNGLVHIERTVRHWEHDGRRLLDGSAGFQVVASDDAITAVLATPQTMPGSYAIEIESPAKRATLLAGTAQSETLTKDEFVVINGVAIPLRTGMSQRQVINRINDFTSQTGVIADLPVLAGPTRLYTQDFGANAVVEVVSNRAASPSNSGFSTVRDKSTGTDIQLNIGGNSYTGNGSSVVATGGAELGLEVRANPSSNDPIVTNTGPSGRIDVTNHSPVFVIAPPHGEPVSLAIPSLKPTALATHLVENRFTSLSKIKVLSSRQSAHSLFVIDEALQDLRGTEQEISDLLATHAYPYGISTLEALDGTGFLLRDDHSLLPAGIEVGPMSEFEEGVAWLQDSTTLQEIHDGGFVGTRLSTPEGWLYGWIGVQIDEDSSMRITDAAWNTIPSKSVMTAITPEPNSAIFQRLIFFGILLSTRQRSLRKANA